MTLYGCQLWLSLSDSDILALGRAPRYCVKLAQRLPIRIPCDICTDIAGFPSVCAEIDYRKLLVLHRLCNTDSNRYVKRLFNITLESYCQDSEECSGFIPDIVSILRRYDLHEHFLTLSNVLYPAKISGNLL